jgi:hypothetical protein
MVFRRIAAVTALAATLMLVTGTVAFADQGSGNGQTPRSASLGFVAKSDLTGQLNYNADPIGEDAGFSVHCDGYTSFKLVTLGDGSLKIIVSATCTDQDGNTLYLKAAMTDRGEPGINDSVCILWSNTSRPTNANSFIHDHGVISSGNIQIIDDPDLGLTAEMLSTE